MNIGIAGGSGMLGVPLAEKLIIEGHQVTVLGRRTLAIDPKGMRYKYVKVDFRDRSSVIKSIHDLDSVIVLAAADGNAEFKLKHGFDIACNNLAMISNLALAAAESRVNRIVFASSSEVHLGESPKYHQPPSGLDWTKLVTNGYAFSKAASEVVLLGLALESCQSVRILRLSNVFGVLRGYGPRMTVVEAWIRRAVNGEIIPIAGNINHVLSLAHIEGVLAALTRSALENNGLEIWEIVDYRITLGNLAKVIRRATGSSSKIGFLSPDSSSAEFDLRDDRILLAKGDVMTLETQIAQMAKNVTANQ